MRWIPNPFPHVDDKRIVIRFALWPTRVGQHRIWLERYGVIQKRIRTVSGDFWTTLGDIHLQRIPYEDISTWNE